MRNPIRLKNLSTRFLPLYFVGAAMLLFWPPQPEGLFFALPLITAGAALRGWGAGHLVKNAELTTSGPYAYLRHPLYLGTIMTATGFAIWVGGWPTLAVLALVWPWFAFHYFPRKERVESDRLEAAYGERFRRYRNEVPALWPRLNAWLGPPDHDGPWRPDPYRQTTTHARPRVDAIPRNRPACTGRYGHAPEQPNDDEWDVCGGRLT